MNKYTVVLVYPSHLCSEDGDESFVDHVSAEDYEGAVTKSRRRCEKSNGFEKYEMDGAHVAAVFEGHLESLW